MFKVGDIVTLKKSSELIRSNVLFNDNPVGINGVIVDNSVSLEFKYKVEWDDGTKNVYRDRDLEFPRVLHTKLAEKMLPNGFKEDKYWVLK